MKDWQTQTAKCLRELAKRIEEGYYQDGQIDIETPIRDLGSAFCPKLEPTGEERITLRLYRKDKRNV